jgi:hypothetical protein
MFGGRETLAAACHIVDPDDIFRFQDFHPPAPHFFFARLHGISRRSKAVVVLIDQAAHIGDSDLTRRAPAIVAGVIGMKRLPTQQALAFLRLIGGLRDVVAFNQGPIRSHDTRRRSKNEGVRTALPT